jgi:hypothetical protein
MVIEVQGGLEMSILASLFIKKCNEILPPLPKEQRTAENIISKMEYNKVKSLDIQKLTFEVKTQFTENMRHKKLKGFTIKAIREYLEQNVKAYPKIHYKNDCHKIHTILNSGAITAEQLYHVKGMLR